MTVEKYNHIPCDCENFGIGLGTDIEHAGFPREDSQSAYQFAFDRDKQMGIPMIGLVHQFLWDAEWTGHDVVHARFMVEFMDQIHAWKMKHSTWLSNRNISLKL